MPENFDPIPPGAITAEETVSRTEQALEFIESREVRTVGRLRDALELLRDHRDNRPVDQSLLPTALLDSFQLQQIHKNLSGFEGSGIDRLLTRMVSDPLHPRDSKDETPGRDAQFELFLAAQLAPTNISGLHFEEPDLVVEVDGLYFGFAAKRLKSSTQFRPRAKKGFEQLQLQGDSHRITHGILALDVSAMHNPNAVAAISKTIQSKSSPARDLLIRPAEKQVKDFNYFSDLRGRSKSRLTCGILLCGSMSLLAPEIGGAANYADFSLLRLGCDHREALDALNEAITPAE